MSWRDALLPAKLNQVPFLFKTVSGTGGRRNTLFEYPLRDRPYVEDLGRAAKHYKVAAFLLGPDYHVDRDDLIDVLDSGAVLDFQHPYRGVIPVKLLGTFDWSETDTEGGMVTFDFTLVEAGSGFPLTSVASPFKVKRLAAEAADVLEKKTRFSLVGAIGAVVHSVTNGIGKATSALRKMNGKIGAGLALIDDLAFAFQSFDKELTTLVNQPQVLMNKFLGLKSSVMGLIRDFEPPTPLVDVIGFKPAVIGLLLEVLEALNAVVQIPVAIPTPTPQYVLEALNLAAIDLADKAGSVIYAAEAAAAQTLESASQALEVQTALVASFDAVLATDNLDPEVLEAIAALKAATVEHLTAQQQRLPDLATYTVAQTMPALVVAYEIYGDSERDVDIIDRNGVRHPGFVPGGTVLEVLADG